MNLFKIKIPIWVILIVLKFSLIKLVMASGPEALFPTFETYIINSGDPSKGSIYLIGTVHDTNEESLNNISHPESALCKDGYTNIINQLARHKDILLFEGGSHRQISLCPSIYKEDNYGKVSEYVKFNFELYMASWDDRQQTQFTRLQEKIFNHVYRNRQFLTPVLLLRAEILFLYTALYERNQTLIKHASDAINKAPSNKNIFILMGDNHLNDPQLLEFFRITNRNIIAYRFKHNFENINLRFEQTIKQLYTLGENPQNLIQTYNNFKSQAIRNKGVDTDLFASYTKQILGLELNLCDIALTQ